MKETINKYDIHLQNLVFFFKSRISYVIENTLKYIELSDFLDHIVMKDRHIKYQELSEMIQSIFAETNGECLVLINANLGAKKQSINASA